MTSMHNQTIVDALVVRCTEELFNAYDVKIARQLEPDPLPAGDGAFAGVVGFTGPAMKGTLVLAPTAALLQRSFLGASCEFRDWAGELANQLIGRLKNQLRNCGAEIFITTPVVIRGLQLAAAPHGETSLHSFAASPGNVSVWFDAQVEEGVTLAVPDVQSGPAEGDAILF